jgi:hypothetical protein
MINHCKRQIVQQTTLFFAEKKLWHYIGNKKPLFLKSGAPYIKKARLPTRVLKNSRALTQMTYVCVSRRSFFNHKLMVKLICFATTFYFARLHRKLAMLNGQQK